MGLGLAIHIPGSKNPCTWLRLGTLCAAQSDTSEHTYQQVSETLHMPSTLQTRRKSRFRPTTYSDYHRDVARLTPLGVSRAEIATRTGYSRSHISRIANMPEVKEEVATCLAHQALALMTTLGRDAYFVTRHD